MISVKSKTPRPKRQQINGTQLSAPIGTFVFDKIKEGGGGVENIINSSSDYFHFLN